MRMVLNRMHARQEQMRAIVGNAYLSTYVSKKGVASSGGSFSTPWMLCCTPTLPCAALRPLCPLPASSPRAAWWDKCGDMLCADVSSPPDLLLLFSAKIFFWFSASFFRFAITSACDLVMSDVVCCTWRGGVGSSVRCSSSAACVPRQVDSIAPVPVDFPLGLFKRDVIGCSRVWNSCAESVRIGEILCTPLAKQGSVDPERCLALGAIPKRNTAFRRGRSQHTSITAMEHTPRRGGGAGRGGGRSAGGALTAPSPTSAKRDCCRASTREPPTCMAAMANTATSATAVLPTIVPSRFK
mmetsp:Transcript_22341/g.53514  ORF Transcript_22341/g.53514 Transcript_22341/m.53514 type:complete len:298 (+) Transcript_22341:220-1113(+)